MKNRIKAAGFPSEGDFASKHGVKLRRRQEKIQISGVTDALPYFAELIWSQLLRV
jgi:hypothetical protein